jgi:hypothetical protein
MKLNAQKYYTSLFVIVLFLQLYLPSFRANTILQLGVLMLFFFLEKVSISTSFLKQLTPLYCILVVGGIGTIIYNYLFFNVLKDIIHFIKPILGIAIGYLFYKKINNFRYFIKTIVLSGLVSALIHFMIIIRYGGLVSGSINEIREFSRDNFLELFALFFLVFYAKFQLEALFKKTIYTQIIIAILLVSNILYFSRTMAVVAIILFLSLKGYTLLTQKSIKVIVGVLIIIGLFYGTLFSIKIDRNKPGIQAFLYKVKIAPTEIFKTNIDRENHKDLWDHWRGYEAKRAFALMGKHPESILFGTGHGSLVNLKFKAPLGIDGKGIQYISELHNGYVYILYKTGIIGIGMYLLFLIGLYRRIYFNTKIITVYISAIGLVFMFTTLTITGIYNPRDINVFILGALLFFKKEG